MNLPPRQRMARELRERCRQLPGGSRLDTVRKLMEEYTTSQRTVEQVLNELAADGLLVRRPGSGWYVRDNSAEKVRRYLLIFPAWPSPNYRELESEFRQQADGARFKVDTVNLNYDEQFFRNIRVESYDAVIVTPPAGPLLPQPLKLPASASASSRQPSRFIIGSPLEQIKMPQSAEKSIIRKYIMSRRSAQPKIRRF